jgi:beta-galactosidase
MEEKYGTYPARARVLRTTADLHLSWDVPYEPGTLKAVGTKDGKPAVTLEIPTTGAPAGIALSLDRESVAADRRDVVHATVQLVDEKGRCVPTADHEITFAIEGDARLIGVDSGNPGSHEDYRSNRRKAFNGLCLAIIQSTAKPGSVRITASSPGLNPASAVFVTKT